MWRNQSSKGGVQPGEEAALQIAAAFAKNIHSPKELWPPVFIEYHGWFLTKYFSSITNKQKYYILMKKIPVKAIFPIMYNDV